jgi:Leucine-rich repeat (LRR) protein
LSHNRIAALPDEREVLKFQHLLLNDNQIELLPAALPETWASLTKLELFDNPLDPASKALFEKIWFETRKPRSLKVD